MTPAALVLDALTRFGQLQVSSGDVDPAYPVLTHRLASCSPTEALDYVLLFAAYYHLGSAETAFSGDGTGLADLPVAVERRNLRGGRIVTHLASWARFPAAPDEWLRQRFTEDRQANWTALRVNAGAVWGNGRWATYKLAELCGTVLGWPVTAPDMGMTGASGPLAGLRLILPGTTEDEADARGAFVQRRLADRGLVVPLEQVETLLCDYHALADGRYYVGHDIDQQQAQLADTPAGSLDAFWQARAAVFDGKYLGEVNGWQRPDKTRAKVYRQHGVVLDRDEEMPDGHW